MAVVFSQQWGPYLGAGDADRHLCAFVDRVCGGDVGIVWAAHGSCIRCARPSSIKPGSERSSFSNGPRSAPPPAPVTGFWPRTARFFRQVMEQQWRAAIANSEANMAMGRMLSNGFAHMIHSHPDGAAGVARDVV